MAKIYQGNNIQVFLDNIKETAGIHTAQRPFAIAQIVADFASQNDGFNPECILGICRGMMGFNLEYGYFARNKYTLRQILSGKLNNRLMLQRMQSAFDENEGLYRATMTQIARKAGLYFFYSTDLVISDTEVELRALRAAIEARSMAQERHQAALGPTLAANLRSSFASVRSQVVEFVEADESPLILVESSGRIAFANTKARRMFAPLVPRPGDDGMAQLVGTSVHELTPTYIRQSHPEKVAQFFKKPSRALLGTGRPLNAARVDGSEFRCAVSLDILDTGGELLAVARLFDMSDLAKAADKFNAHVDMANATAIEEEAKSLNEFGASLEGAMIVVNINSEIVEGNQAACDLLGCDRAFLLSNPIHAFVPTYIRQAHELRVRYFFSSSALSIGGDDGGKRVFPAQACDGTEVNINITLQKLQFRSQWLAVALMTRLEPEETATHQIKEFQQKFKELEAATSLREKQARANEGAIMQAFLNAGDMAAVAVDELGGMTSVNPACTDVFGYEESELIDRAVDILTPAHVQYNHYAKVTSFFSNSSNRQLGAGTQLSARHKNGEEFPIQITLDLFELGSGRFAVARVRDQSNSLESTARANAIMEKQAEVRAQLEDSLLLDFLSKCSSEHDAAFVVNSGGNVLLMNDAACTMFGYEREEVVGKSVDMLTPRSVRAIHSRKVAFYFLDPSPRQMSGANASSLSLKAAHKNGNEFPVQIALNHLTTRHGTVATCIVRDMGRVKHLVNEVEKAGEEEAERRKKRHAMVDEVIRKNPWMRSVQDA